MTLKYFACLASISFTALAGSAYAEPASPSVQSVLSTMTAGGGSETLRWQIAPTYSELFGLGVRTTVGGYVSDDFALGAIIDYADHREEYLANAGFRLNDSMRVIGSVGFLQESEEFTLGDGREDVSQMEYGLSLKGTYDAGIVRGFEINAYHTTASADTDASEIGDLTGIQIVTQLKPAQATDIRLGAGYERADWAGGDIDEGVTLQVLGSQKLSDTLALNFHVKSAETENLYGVGFTYDMTSSAGPNSALSVSFDKIEGKYGISDDTRVALNWTVGFGAASGGASGVTASSMGSMARADLLADVMTRPAFLPERVLARAADVGLQLCSAVGVTVGYGSQVETDVVFYNTELGSVFAMIQIDRTDIGEFSSVSLNEVNDPVNTNIAGGRRYWEWAGGFRPNPGDDLTLSVNGLECLVGVVDKEGL